MHSNIKKIVMPVRGDGRGDNLLRHAAVLAHRFNAHIEVTHARPQPEDMIPFGVAVSDFLKQQIIDSVRSQADDKEQRLKDELHALARELGLLETETPDGNGATVWLSEQRGRQADMINHLGRLADILLVPQPDGETGVGANTMTTAIFSTGRPVMMCPDKPAPQGFGDRMAIGWNGSVEASRAMRMSMPLIRAAEKIFIMSTDEKRHHGTDAKDLHKFLKMHSVPSEIVTIENRGIIGERLLEACDQVNAGLLVMGAYHEGYAREELFGGNAKSVVEHAKIPVIMAH